MIIWIGISGLGLMIVTPKVSKTLLFCPDYNANVIQWLNKSSNYFPSQNCPHDLSQKTRTFHISVKYKKTSSTKNRGPSKKTRVEMSNGQETFTDGIERLLIYLRMRRRFMKKLVRFLCFTDIVRSDANVMRC